MTELEQISQLVEQKSAAALELNQKIWDYAELNFREDKSARAIADALQAEGFTVEYGVAGVRTAFIATYGTGGPVIALLGEYDALSSLSQKAACPRPEPVTPGAPGHGCGHSLLGAGSFAAAAALKDYIDQTGTAMTVRYYGCPAEEDGGGKVYMARAGLFDDVDAALTWHPGAINETKGVGSLAVMGVLYSFKGQTAHAAAAPQAGRSALDAAELMNIGCQFLREHMLPDCRLHYAFRDVGGTAPNVVQASASLHYYIRAPKVDQMFQLFERVNKVAAGAATMTETEMEYHIIDGFSDYVPNKTLSTLMAQCMAELGAPAFTDADRALAAQFADTIGTEERKDNLESDCADNELPYSYFDNKVLHEEPLPLCYNPRRPSPGSTDVGDVSYCAPTAQCTMATMALGTGGHTWQMTAQSNSSIGDAGMLAAAKVMALTALRAAKNPALLQAARAEWQATCPGPYRCPMPADSKPEF